MLSIAGTYVSSGRGASVRPSDMWFANRRHAGIARRHSRVVTLEHRRHCWPPCYTSQFLQIYSNRKFIMGCFIVLIPKAVILTGWSKWCREVYKNSQGRNSVVNFGGGRALLAACGENIFLCLFYILNFGGGLLSIVWLCLLSWRWGDKPVSKISVHFQINFSPIKDMMTMTMNIVF